MIHMEMFVISKRPYAVDLAGMWAQENRYSCHSVRIPAAWFRRRRGVTVACLGVLAGYLRDEAPADVYDALARMDDGRYGGNCEGRWDGENYWGSQSPAEIGQHLELLRPMLERYPAVPPGYDGWWRYE